MNKTHQAAFKEILRRNKWKSTAQRRAAYEFLMERADHPSVEMVWLAVRKKLPDISLDSIYRILNDFVAAGALQPMECRRVLRYDTNIKRHDHFICTECNRIFDFTCMNLATLPAICASYGTPASVELRVRGRCNHCQTESSAAADN